MNLCVHLTLCHLRFVLSKTALLVLSEFEKTLTMLVMTQRQSHYRTNRCVAIRTYLHSTALIHSYLHRGNIDSHNLNPSVEAPIIIPQRRLTTKQTTSSVTKFERDSRPLLPSSDGEEDFNLTTIEDIHISRVSLKCVRETKASLQ